MRLDMSQNMRMLQQMKLAPRMIQSMEILQLPIMALEERIREEVEQNPTLELGASTTEIASTDFEARYGDAAETPANGEPGSELTKREERVAKEREAFEQMYEEYGDNYMPSHQPSRWAGMELSDKKQDAMLNMADRPAALEEHLLQQLSLQDADPAVLKFATFLVANLDASGFLRSSLDDLRASYEDPVSPEQSAAALDLVHQLDPPGVGARDLRECLLLQLEEPNPEMEYVDVLRTLIRLHLDDLKHNRLPLIERKTGYSPDTLREAIHEMRLLDPNPASRFAPSRTQYVVPDLAVETDEQGNYVIKMNEENTPTVFISPQYLEALRQNHSDEKAKEYIRRKVTQARWLIDAIEQRRNTLEKVARAIIEHQRDFLEKGPDFIQPLKMQHIADRVGVHVTTVSRAVDDKWIQTPRGAFPLKRFFGGGTITDDGKEVAFETIKRRLEEVVNAEDKVNPYSDDDLKDKLRELGYPLARRTVTKYRKMLGISSSRERKQHF